MTTRADARRRDVPRNCTCRWGYRAGPERWVLIQRVPRCPWHLDAHKGAV